MSIFVSDLVAGTRLLADVQNNKNPTNDEIAGLLSDAAAELNDMFTTANQHYSIKTFDFTLTGGVGSHTVAKPDDFQQGHSIDVDPDTTNPKTLTFLSNWLNRNSGVGGDVVFGGGRSYTFLGNNIVVLPARNAAGTYRLYYTPQMEALSLLQTRTITLVDGDGVDDHTTGLWHFTNGAFSAQDVGGTFVVSGDDTLNGTYTIVSVGSETAIVATPHTAGDDPLDVPGASVALTYQPAGTVASLPQYMTPFALFLKVHAALAIKMKRQQPADELTNKLQNLKARIISTIGTQQEEGIQPPLTRRGSNWMDDL